jgi:hypothetical protein
MKGTFQSNVYIFKFIDIEGKEKEAKVTAPSIYKAKQLFNNRYKDKVKEFKTIEDLGWK